MTDAVRCLKELHSYGHKLTDNRAQTVFQRRKDSFPPLKIRNQLLKTTYPPLKSDFDTEETDSAT